MINTRQKVDLDQLKQAIPITELATSLGLTIRGRQARCYNGEAHSHGDRNFSLGLDVKRNRYKCFACGEQGSVIDLYKAVKGVELRQAITELASMAGLNNNQLNQNSYTPATRSHQTSHKPYKTPATPPRPTSEQTEAYSDVYEELFIQCGGLDQESREYLLGRGLTKDTLAQFLLFSVRDYQQADQHLKGKFSRGELQRAGVLSEKGSLIFYKHKIIIPFMSEGRIVFLQGRRIDEGQPKYLHLKRPVPMYNTDVLEGLEKGSKVYVCEGVFDAMVLTQNGYKAVAILGVNSFKPEDTELFKGFDVVLCLDNDEAGERATKELAKMFLLKGQAVTSKRLPDGVKDISDYFKSL